MEVENQVPTSGMEETTEKIVDAIPQTDSLTKDITQENDSSELKKNGTLSGIAEAVVSNAASAAASGLKPSMAERVHTSGIIVQFPEMFSLKRDRQILDKFSNALDVRMQKCAFIECESEEVASQLQAKINGSAMNNKRVNAYRLDLAEKNSLYTSNLKKETTDDLIKQSYIGVEEILREKFSSSRFSVFIKFSTEAECRAARTKIVKEGINGQKVHCDFDMKRDRFIKPEEPETKKIKMDTDEAPQQDGEEMQEAEMEVKKDEVEVEGAEEKEEEDINEGGEDVKADEW